MEQANAKAISSAKGWAFVFLTIIATSASQAQQEETQKWPMIPGIDSKTFSAVKDDLVRIVKLVDELELANVVRINESSIVGYKRPEGRSIDAEIKEPAIWLDLMSRTNILSVDKSDAVYTFAPLGQPIPEGGDHAELIWYEFSEHLPANPCAPEYQDMTCGMCELAREGNWSMRFSWSSGPHIQAYNRSVENISQLLLDGEITSQEWSTRHADYFSEMFESGQKCISQGLEEMGLENPSDHF